MTCRCSRPVRGLPLRGKANSSDLGDAASKDVGTTSGTVAAGDHTHDAANITYNDNASYNTVAACLTDLVNTNLWVENNATNIMRGDKAITTLTLKGKTIATTDQIPDAQIQSDWNQTTTTAKDYIKNKPTIPAAQVNANWNETSSSSKAYIQNKPTLGTAAAKNVGTGASDVAAGNHTHSDYVSKSATSQQSLSGDLYIAQGKSLNLGSAEASGGKVEIAAASATDESSTYMLVGTVGGEYVWMGKDGIGYTTNNENTSTKLSFPTPPSSGQKTGVIATTDQLLQIGTTATTAAAGNHTHSGYAASSHNHAAGDINSGTLAVARGGTGADGSSITKNYVLAAPSASNGAVSFRALTVADLPTGTTSSTVALGNHTHSSISGYDIGLSANSNSPVPAFDIVGNESGELLNIGANNPANTDYLSLDANGLYIIDRATKDDWVYFARDGIHIVPSWNNDEDYVLAFPQITANKTIATTDHTHSDYVSKSETSSQSLSGSLSFPATKQAYFGNQNSSYAWVWDGGFGVGVGSTDHTGIQHDRITHTVSSDTVTLTFPSSAKSGVIATDYDIRKMTRVLYESVTGDSSTPATSITISEDYNVYSFWLAANGTFPTFTFSFPNFSSVAARFPFTLIVNTSLVTASTLTGPSGWAWVSGATLPSSGFANKNLWISGIIKTNDSTAVPLVSCWRCA